MTFRLTKQDIFGFLKTEMDAHTMGLANMANLLRACGYKVVIADNDVMRAAEHPERFNNQSRIQQWIQDNNISVLSFSYRLDPNIGSEIFIRLVNLIHDMHLDVHHKGSIKITALAALPDTCDIVKNQLNHDCLLFPGGEQPEESLIKYGVSPEDINKLGYINHPYDKFLKEFANQYIESGHYKTVSPPNHYGYPECGTSKDSYIHRLNYCKQHHSLPIIRAHAGPYSDNRLEAVAEFNDWAQQLAKARFLDVLSVGSSQLTQQHFGENWDGMLNGGGVPINSEIEYVRLRECARPMLVRTYAGTKDVPGMAAMHERSLNISWHALSLWWFCELDGRGDNTLLENLKEHIETIRYIASTGKPLEPNVPHHFSFRGGDDVTYIISGYLAAKTAKLYGIQHLILQNMLNTPKSTIAAQDIAKSRALLKLVRSLEDSTFQVSLQCRAGLEYFAPDVDTAKCQLAQVTAMMDDIEPDNPNSPEIIHVVSYSEAIRLATPEIINESIRITLGALNYYRNLKKQGKTFDTTHDREINDRSIELFEEACAAINILETRIPNLYTAKGLFKVFKDGYLPTPYLMDPKNKFPKARKWQTANINGGISVIDNNGQPISCIKRFNNL